MAFFIPWRAVLRRKDVFLRCEGNTRRSVGIRRCFRDFIGRAGLTFASSELRSLVQGNRDGGEVLVAIRSFRFVENDGREEKMSRSEAESYRGLICREMYQQAFAMLGALAWQVTEP